MTWPGVLGCCEVDDAPTELPVKVVRLSERALTLVALALVTRDERLLVVETPRGQLELPGLEIGEPGPTAGRLVQFMSKLGLDQTPCQTLYLPGLRPRRHQSTPVMGIIQVVRLARAQPFDIPGSRYETTKFLVEEETATLTTRVVARWLLQARP